jgi:hypothetical protein
MVQFMVEEFEDLLLAGLEELRERPTVAAALLAAVVGALVGGWIAERQRPKPVVKPPTQLLAEMLAPIALAIGRARLRGMAGSIGQQAGPGARRAGDKAAEPAAGAGNAVAVFPMLMRLAQSPIVRAIVVTIIARRIRAAR